MSNITTSFLNNFLFCSVGVFIILYLYFKLPILLLETSFEVDSESFSDRLKLDYWPETKSCRGKFTFGISQIPIFKKSCRQKHFTKRSVVYVQFSLKYFLEIQQTC